MTFPARAFFVSFVLVAFAALTHAAPVLDTTFGAQGVTRIGVLSGFEDVATTSAIVGDGRILVGGMSSGRQSYAFVTRFTTAGTLDPTFGNSGTTLLSLPPSYFWMAPVQIEPMADGGVLVVSTLYNGFVLTRLTTLGIPDSSFGSGGSVVVDDAAVNKGNQDTAAIKVVNMDLFDRKRNSAHGGETPPSIFRSGCFTCNTHIS